MPFLRFICTLCGPSHDPCQHVRERIWDDDDKFFRHILLDIVHLLNRQSGFFISQLEGETLMPITGIVAGQSGVFKETPLPVGAQIPAGTVPQWSASDPSISLTPAADGTTVTVAVPSDTTLTTFELKVQNQDGSFPTTVEVPILPPPPPAQTGFQIDQVS